MIQTYFTLWCLNVFANADPTAWKTSISLGLTIVKCSLLQVPFLSAFVASVIPNEAPVQ